MDFIELQLITLCGSFEKLNIIKLHIIIIKKKIACHKSLSASY